MSCNDIHQLADEARFNKYHAGVLAWCFLVLVVDGYDLAIAGAALPSIMQAMNVDATTAGFMASSALLGMMVGGIGLSTLADRVGRRLAVCICIFMFSVFTAATGFTSDPVTFSVMRFLAGIGIGGAIPIVAAQMSEYSPRKIRSFMVTLMCCGYPVGSLIAALLGKQFLEAYGWQIVFLAAGAPVLMVPLIFKFMPESLSYLIRHGKEAELRRIAAQIAPDQHFTWTASDMPQESHTQNASVTQLFSNGRSFSTLMLWIACFTGLFMTYALSTWLVKLMAMSGYSLGSALNFLMAFNAGAVVGAVGGGWLGDRFNLKWVLCGFYFLSAVCLIMLGYGVQPVLLVVALVGASTLGTQILCYAYAGQFYPMAIRATGIGFASGIGRTGAIIAPIIIGMLVAAKLPLEQNFIAIAAAGVLGSLAVACVNHRLVSSAAAETLPAQALSQGASS